MSNWTSNTAPNYYKDIGDERIEERPFHPNDEGSLFQTDRGWEREIVYTDQHGRTRTKRYVEVADRQAQTDAPSLYITDVRVQNATDYSTTVPEVRGGTAGDSYEIVLTFNQAVATGTGVTWDVVSTGTIAAATYKSGNMTNTLTFEVDTSSESSTDQIMLRPNTAVADVFTWDARTNTAIAVPSTLSPGTNAASYGFPFQVLASGAVGTANVVIA